MNSNAPVGALDLNVRLSQGEFSLNVCQELPLDGVTAVFGRSGSGKTSLLRCIAGFDRGAGHIRFREQCWFDSSSKQFVAPHLRGVGYMFQNAGLFPHLDVTGNLRYAQQRASKPNADIPQVVDFEKVVSAFALTDLLKRAPTQLSGGEAQRVALARTLLTQPRLLLLDEPLAALDDAHKAELLPFLEILVRDFGLPVIYVSHDVEEVARLATRMLVMEAGEVSAFGSTRSLFERLDIPEVSGRLEASALVDARVVEHDERWMLTRLAVAGQVISVPERSKLRVGDAVRLRVQARDVALARHKPEGLSIRNLFEGRVHNLEIDASTPFADVVVELDDPTQASSPVRLRSRITRAAADELELAPGVAVFALVKSVILDG